MIDPELRDIIEPELAEGEALLWAEDYKRHPIRLASDFYAFGILTICIVSSIIWTIAAIVLTFYPTPGTPIILFPIFAIFGVGMFFAIKNFWLYSAYEFFGARSRRYALTNSRALIMETNWPRRKLSFSRHDFDEVHRLKLFLQPRALSFKALSKLRPSNPIRALVSKKLHLLLPVFENIKNPDHVEALILKHFPPTEQPS